MRSSVPAASNIGSRSAMNSMWNGCPRPRVRTCNCPPCWSSTATTVTVDADTLSRVEVTAEVVGPAKGPKIRMILYKNKTGYRRRQGHRQHLTRLRVTGIDTGTG